MKLIFLDIDGVLNCEEGYHTGMCKERDIYGQLFHTPSAQLLNAVIAKHNAKIVISSTWRHSGLTVMQSMWIDREMSGTVIGITPHLTIPNSSQSCPRGVEIKEYLHTKQFHHCDWSKALQEEVMKVSDITSYAIIDDDSDMLYGQRKQFVHVLPSPRNKTGFNQQYAAQLDKILSSDIITLNFK